MLWRMRSYCDGITCFDMAPTASVAMTGSRRAINMAGRLESEAILRTIPERSAAICSILVRT